MWLSRFFDRRRSQDTLDRLAVRIAQECHRDVWSRVCHRVLLMRLNEARGYVRARAAQCIQARVDATLRRNPQLPERYQAELTARATDQVVGLVIRDVLVMPQQAPSQRRAA